MSEGTDFHVPVIVIEMIAALLPEAFKENANDMAIGLREA